MQAVLVGSCAAFRTEFLKTSSGEHAYIILPFLELVSVSTRIPKEYTV